jgi:D-glycero-D-manno-heptose 1,7-bisphosphate phosphatase
MNERLNDLLVMAGAPAIDAMYWCPHSPQSECVCRKPKPGMLLEAAKNLNIDMANSYMIGDDVRDMEAARAAGLRKKIMVVSDRYTKNDVADVVCPTFLDAVRAILLMGAMA